jgi:preprotein translocase subunit YajC
MIGMMFFSSRKNKQRQQEAVSFRKSLEKGDEIMTGSGLIGKVVELDEETNSVVVDSEGTKSRWLVDAITKRPAAVEPTPEVVEDEKKEGSKEVEAKGEADNAEDNGDDKKEIKKE